MTSLNSLNGVSCGADGTGTTRVVYAAGTVAIFCDPPAPPAEGPPVYTGVAVGGNIATVTFNKPVCRVVPWNPSSWQIATSGILGPEDFGDRIPLCNALANNGVSTGSVLLQNPPTPGSLVDVTLTGSGHLELRDALGNLATGPQTQTGTAGPPERIPPTLVSAAGNVGATTLMLNFSEPVWCNGFFVPGNIFLTDNNPSTTDPVPVGMGSSTCGATQLTASTSFSITLSAALPGSTTFTLSIVGGFGQIEDMSLNSLPIPSSTTFTTPAPDFTPPTLTDTRAVNNIASTDFTDPGDAFSVTFSEKMNGNIFGSTSIVDQDGTTATITCGNNASCTWNTAVTTLTVTLTQSLANSGGTTPGVQLPATISALIGLTDLAGNAPDLPGSADRVIDNE